MIDQPAPYLLKPASVTQVMAQVLLALLPGIAAYVWWFGPAILVQLAIASATALAAEALILALRGKPLGPFLSDLSALVTAWLLALTLPPTVPWWLTVVAVLFAIVVAKHLYGGLGQNPFNPAMVGFAVVIVSYPALVSQWPGIAGPDTFASQLDAILGQRAGLDALTGATPLDHLKTALKLAEGSGSVAMVLGDATVYGHVAGKGWEWVGLGYLAGGLFLIARRIMTWHVPAAYLGAMALLAGGLWLFDSQNFASPLFHLLSGGTLLGAFFIATDPVSGSTTPRGKLIFAAGAASLAYVIRVFGGYPDGVAFGVLLMNLCVPLIDMYTQPPIFGAKAMAAAGRKGER